MKAQPPGRAILSRPRSRRDAAKILGVALQSRYRKLLEASGEDEIVVATADLAQCMYENVEFVIWALKVQGGLNPPPPEQLRKIIPPSSVLPVSSEAMKQACDDTRACFAKPPEPVLAPDLPNDCTCPPLEVGIIGRERHMTSCPKFVP